MQKFEIGTFVVWSHMVEKEAGEDAGVVIGYYNDYSPIIYLTKPTHNGELASVVHESTIIERK